MCFRVAGVIIVGGNPQQQTGKEVDPNANSVNQFSHGECE